jgi:hypothetical protein
MLKAMARRILSQFDYEIRRISTNRREEGPGYVLHRYLKKDGSFDYEAYRTIQEAGNKRKLGNVWVKEENIAFLAEYLRGVIPPPRFGLCHGTRRGNEQAWFSKYLGCDVLGTDISETAESFPQTIRWDFHEVKPEWIDAVDFIYSNSFDHSYDPEKCLNAWMRCVRPGGICILEHAEMRHADYASAADQLDPFGALIFQMPYLITTWGKGKYGVRELLTAPIKSDKVSHLHFIVIHRFP